MGFHFMNLIRQGIEDLPCKGKGSVEKPGREEEFNCAVGAKLWLSLPLIPKGKKSVKSSNLL